MNWKKFNILKVDGLANILFFIVMILLLMRYSWAKSYYVCDLTGCEKMIVRVFGVPVHTTKLETEASRWLDARLGSTKYRRWQRIGFQTMIGGPVCACKPIPLYIYQLYQNDPDRNDKHWNAMLEDLRKARQNVNKDSRGEESETEY